MDKKILGNETYFRLEEIAHELLSFGYQNTDV